jgi:hypothetical protein
MVKDESEKTEQVLEAITAIKDKAEDEAVQSSAKDGVNLEGIVKKLARKRQRQSSSK